jgi:hypothetical protein
MAGKKDIVEQALKLIAGGLKESGPTAVERAAQNLDVFNTAKRLGEDTNDLAKLQETKRLMEFHKNLMGDVNERAQALAEIQRQMREQGAFPMEVGTRYTTEQTRRLGQPPYVVQGYYVNPKDPYNSYGYRYRQEYPNGDFSEGHAMIRDPKLEKLHGPEKWEEIQRGIVPMTGPKVVKQVGGRTGYAGRGRVVGDVVDAALKLIGGVAKSDGDDALRKYMSPSYIKDSAGNPIRLYHATPNTFDVFDVSQKSDSGPAIFLSPYANKQPAMHNTGGAEGQFKEGTNVMPVYARVKSPLVIDTPDMLEWSRNVYGSEFPHFITPEARKSLIDDGYDGVVFGGYKPQEYATGVDIGKQPHGDEEVIVLHPEQVKSAISNEGSYDPNDPRINKDAGGRTGYGPGGVIDDIVEMAGKIVSGADEPATTGIRAYHGSPHDFDKFDMSKIGTGEGAQAYGHGLYFAESEPVAQGYKNTLAGGPLGIDIYNKVSDYFGGYHPIASSTSVLDTIKYATNKGEDVRSALLRRAKSLENSPNDYDRSIAQEVAKLANDEGFVSAVNRPFGHMYEVNIAADPNTFLDWDKPLSEQPSSVQAAIRATRKNLPTNAMDDLGGDYSLLYGQDIRPGQFLNTLEQIGGRPDFGEGLLKQQGIPGIKYLDAGSRGKGVAYVQPMYKGKPYGDPVPAHAWNQVDQLTQRYKDMGYDVEVQDLGTRNYVVFDDKLISIIRKYGIAGASAMLGYNLMENLNPEQAKAATVADRDYKSSGSYTGGMLPVGMEPSGEITSRIPSAGERIYDYVRSSLGGDEETKSQRAETVMNIIDQTPLTLGPISYDVARSVAEAAGYAEGGDVGESYDPDIEDAINIARLEAQGPFLPSPPEPNLPSDGTYVENRPSKMELTTSIIAPYITEPASTVKRFMDTPLEVLLGAGTPAQQEAAVADSLNIAATLGGVSSVVPVPKNSLGVFGGIKSLTANKPAIREAMAMESKGSSPLEIYDKTGWFRGADKNWRYEISDKDTTVNSSAFQIPSAPVDYMNARLADYFQHPELFNAYPQFKNMEVRTFTGDPTYLGKYHPRYDRGTIVGGISEPYISLNQNLLSSGEAQHSTLLHEIQHAIQQKEGFGPGSNIEVQPFDRVNPSYERYQNAVENDPEMRQLMSIRSSIDYKDQIRYANELYNLKYKQAEKDIETSEIPDVDKKIALDALRDQYAAEEKRLFPALAEVEQLKKIVLSRNIPLYAPKQYFTPLESYLHYAGEVEARNVQNRRNFPSQGRETIPPWDTQDYAYIDQIFPENDFTWRFGYAEGGAVEDEEGWLDTALTVARNAADKATFGTSKYGMAGADYLTDAALDALGYENDADFDRSLAEQEYAMKEGEEKHPAAAGVGDILGYVAPYLAVGPAQGALSTLGYASDYGGKVGKTGSLFARALGYADGGEVPERGYLESVGDAINSAANPIRRVVGVRTVDLPEGMSEVDYGQLLNLAADILNRSMIGFSGADPYYKRPMKMPVSPKGKIVDRVPQDEPDFNKGGRVTGGNTYDNNKSVEHALALTSEY